MKVSLLLAAGLGLIFGAHLCVQPAEAAMITFTYTGTGSGSVGSTTFTNAAFTFTAVADTNNRTAGSDFFIVNNDSASAAIEGVGAVTIFTQTSSAVNNLFETVVFGNPGASRALYIQGSNPAFSTWDLTTSIGPLTLPGSLLQWFVAPLSTSGGTLVFNTATTQGTFQAVVVPSPGVLALGGSALVLHRTRRRS